MRMYDIIEKKRDKKSLTYEELKFFVKGITNKTIPDYQTTALLMAAFLNGLDERETFQLCQLMAASGDQMTFPDDLPTADKHSTGGVGDKTSLIVGPIVAANGLVLAKMSGRALGHTGGTVDKLESIPNFNATLSLEQFHDIYKRSNLCITGQTGNMVPADKILYGLRDVTATVDNVSLIATSIMSKKLAAGAKNIVLDVKTGDGAFMSTIKAAEELAEKMVEIGVNNNRNISALITNMNYPLGYNVGNSLEVIEAIEVLKGNVKGPLYEVSMALAGELIHLATNKGQDVCYQLAIDSINNGSALEKLREMISNQGGNVDVIKDYTLFKQPNETIKVYSKDSGYISDIKAKTIGEISMQLGAGRITKTTPIDMSAGIILNKTVGDYIDKGELLATLYTDKKNLPNIIDDFLKTITLSSNEVKKVKTVIGRVTKKQTIYY